MCLAATKSNTKDCCKLPINEKPFRKYFRHSGLLIDHGQNHHTIVSTNKGGVVYHYLNNKLVVRNDGLVAKKNNKYFAL